MDVIVQPDHGVDKKSIKISENGDSRGQNSDVVVDIINDDDGRSRKSDEGSNKDKMCRICHLSDDDDDDDDGGSTEGSSELIKLGCDCRGELALSHQNCADAWFSQKGNRVCEICGKTAKNMSSRYDENERVMMEVSEIRVVVGSNENSNTQPCKQMSFCNLLLCCLLLAFFLPWFFQGMDLLL